MVLPRAIEAPAADFWRRRRVLVTGATGLLGSHLVRALVDRGADVVAVVRDAVPPSLLVSSGLLDRVMVVHGSVTDQPLLQRALVEYEIRSVFHLAAQTIVPYALANPVETMDVNIGGTYRLLEACRLYGRCEEIVVASSDKAYGRQETLPYVEDLPMQGTYPYDVSKSCADLIARAFAHTYGLPIAVTRLANLYGPGDLNFSRLIPGTIRSLLLGEPILIRSDGTLQREYLYVENGAEAYLTLAEQVRSGGLGGNAFNFGQGGPLSVLEVVAAIKQVMGKTDAEVRVLNEPGAKAEIQAQWLDATRARNVLGWEPEWTFEEGLERTVPWYREYLR
jgi:CDP-glucose 4,6-dehydratase